MSKSVRFPVLSLFVLFGFSLFFTASYVASDETRPSLQLQPVAGREPDNIAYLSMKESTSLRTDSSGEEAVEFFVQNAGTAPIHSSSFYIRTPTAEYSNVRTWDDAGSLQHTIVIDDGDILVTIHFRQPLAPGASYRYSIAIDLGSIIQRNGIEWYFGWGTYFPVAQFERQVVLPPGANITFVTPTPNSQTADTVTWLRQNMTSFTLELTYTLRDLTDQELAEKYSPYFRIHEDDGYVPMSVDLALQHAFEIRDHNSADSVQGGLTLANLASERWREKPEAYIDFHGDPTVNGGTSESHEYYKNNVKSAAVADPVIYARVIRNAQNNIIIQYWFYYFYSGWGIHNGLNVHEGDWEMIQLLLDSNENPLQASYAQHSGGSSKEWNDLARDDTHPIVYVSLGSHASYFGPYSYILGQDRTAGEEVELLKPTEIRLFPEAADSWVYFRGHWGEKGRFSITPPYTTSGPVSPSQQGSKWSNPLNWGDNALWDELSAHHIGKVRVWIAAPCNVGIRDRLTGDRVGWFYNTSYNEIESGEYIVNETVGIRSTIVHDSLFLKHLRYDIDWTCETSTTPSRTNLNGVSGTIEYVDDVLQEVITLTYELPAGWNPENSIARVTLSEQSNFEMAVDLNGDGTAEYYAPPVSRETEPLPPPGGIGFNYLPFIQ